MARLPLDQLAPGMVLTEPLKNANGSVMLPAGSALSEKHLRAMKMWGILDVAVQSEGTQNNAPAAVPADPALLDQAKAELARHFALTDLNDPIMAEIFNQAVMHYGRSASPSNK